jgi:hypothetical protein
MLYWYFDMISPSLSGIFGGDVSSSLAPFNSHEFLLEMLLAPFNSLGILNIFD